MNADIRTVLSLCAGYGGLDLGFHRAVSGSRTVCYVENEIPATAILAHNIEKGRLDDAPIWSDLKTFDPGPFRGKIDAILGGFPCQPFSVAGQRRGSEDPRHLWPYIARIVETIQPRICVFENVRGLVSARTIQHRKDLVDWIAEIRENGDVQGARAAWYANRHADRLHRRLLKECGISALLYVLCDLESIGYRCEWGIFSAAEVGAPHRRERVFILGHLPGSGGNMEHPARIAEREPNDEASTEPRQDARTMPGRGRASLAHRIREGLQGHARDEAGSQEPGRVAQGQDGPIGAGSLLLANTQSDQRGSRGSRKETGQSNVVNSGSGLSWPSRPGQPQHEWEEPRTVDRKLNPSWVAQLMGLPHDCVEVPGLTREMKLRALGNGVVPQQADLAIRTLRAEPLQSQEPQGPPSQT